MLRGWLALIGSLLVSAVAVAEARMIMAPEPPHFDPRVQGEVVARADGPPPISGGTLIALADGHRAAMSDPDRDRLVIAELEGSAARAIALPARSEPGRLVEDAAGRIHVVLRGSGELATLAARDATTVSRRRVCPMPRGLTYVGTDDTVVVACRSGELVTLPAAGGEPTRTAQLDRDLRDVVVEGDHLLVSRFRSAEVLVVRDGVVSERRALADVDHDGQPFQNEVAWRLVARPDGGATLVHQRASRGEVVPSFGGYGSRFGGCTGIVRSAVSVSGADGNENGPELPIALPVDLAMRAGADGAIDATVVVAAGEEIGTMPVVWLAGGGEGDPSACVGSAWSPRTSIPNPIAVAFTRDGRLLIQQRSPAGLIVVSADRTDERAIDLEGDDRFDTGHAIFHAATAANVSCSSCHPEGGDDGHVWLFSGLGARRTPALHAVAHSAPFHWSGDIADIDALMSEVFVNRMGGEPVDAAHARSVEGWLGHLAAPRAHPGDEAAIARGRALFEGSAGCADCHAGPLLSNGESRDVGTGGSFQVPSLIGAADRLPLMHTGCATTMAARFDPACGGDRHGPALDAEATADLVAYLESL
jgi:mono/diheme cytochrome c family protein